MKPEERKQLYTNLFMSENGRTVIKDLLKKYELNNSSFNTDHSKMAYVEGQKDVIRFILKQIEA